MGSRPSGPEFVLAPVFGATDPRRSTSSEDTRWTLPPGPPPQPRRRTSPTSITVVAILLVAYFYAWGKGVFRWD